MHSIRQPLGGGLALRGRLKSSARALLSVGLVLLQVQSALSAIVNTVTVTGTAQNTTVVTTDTATVTLAPPTPQILAVKSGVLRDDDGRPGLSAGDTILYTISVANTGTGPLTGITISDPMISLSFVAGDTDNPGVLDPGEVWTHEGVYAVTAEDIASNGGGDSDIDNTATVSSNELPPQTVTATIPIDIGQATATVTGIVYVDRNGDGAFDDQDTPAGAGFIVELVNAAGDIVGNAVSDSNGFYSISALPAAGYRIQFRRPNGSVLGEIGNLELPPGTTVVDQNMPIDPSGVVYDSRTRLPVAGAMVTMTDDAGQPLPAACFLTPAQQNQTTGADGGYRFDLMAGAHSACPAGRSEYRLAVTVPAGYTPGASDVLPPEAGALNVRTCPVDATPGGACNVSASATAPSGNGTLYFMAFLLAAGDPDLVNNHIPLDPLAGTVSGLSKRALDSDVMRGEKVAFVIEARGTTINPATLVDVVPPGFTYVKGSARVNGTAMEPAIDGRRLVFAGLAPDNDSRLKLELTLLASAAVSPGNHTNTAQLIDEFLNRTIATAKATVTVIPDPVFDCGEVIGRVFDDRNRNGYADDGEPGLPGVRVATVNGLLVTTDRHGRFHVACADLPDSDIGSNFVMKLDTRTLPEGYRVTSENPRDVRLTPGKITKLNFGAAAHRMVKLDLEDAAFVPGGKPLKPAWNDGIRDLIGILAEKPSILTVIYHAADEPKALVKARLAAIAKQVKEEWKRQGEPYRLMIETRTKAKGQ